MQNVDGQLIWIKKREKNRNLVIYTVDFHILSVYHSKQHCSKRKQIVPLVHLTVFIVYGIMCRVHTAVCALLNSETNWQHDAGRNLPTSQSILDSKLDQFGYLLRTSSKIPLNTKNGIAVRERWKFVTIFFYFRSSKSWRTQKTSWWSTKNDKPTN